MPAAPTTAWLKLIAAAALLLATGAALLLAGPARKSGRAAQAIPDAGCPTSDVEPPLAMAGAEAPPVILWAAGPVKLFVDGAPAFSAPDNPKALPPGEHTLRAEAPGAEPLQTRFRVDSFTPAFFHVQFDAPTGISLARLGTVCSSCDAPLDKVTLEPERSTVGTAVLLAEAARALRSDDWRSAAAKLRGIPPSARRDPLYARLAAAVFASTSQWTDARQQLEALDPGPANEVGPLLVRLEALKEVERRRHQQVVLARWNALTERFARLVSRFEREVPGPVVGSARRLAELSKAFFDSNRQGDLEEQHTNLLAAQEALSTLVGQLRASRPLDCAFQQDVTRTLLR